MLPTSPSDALICHPLQCNSSRDYHKEIFSGLHLIPFSNLLLLDGQTMRSSKTEKEQNVSFLDSRDQKQGWGAPCRSRDSPLPPWFWGLWSKFLSGRWSLVWWNACWEMSVSSIPWSCADLAILFPDCPWVALKGGWHPFPPQGGLLLLFMGSLLPTSFQPQGGRKCELRSEGACAKLRTITCVPGYSTSSANRKAPKAWTC